MDLEIPKFFKYAFDSSRLQWISLHGSWRDGSFKIECLFVLHEINIKVIWVWETLKVLFYIYIRIVIILIIIFLMGTDISNMS